MKTYELAQSEPAKNQGIISESQPLWSVTTLAVVIALFFVHDISRAQPAGSHSVVSMVLPKSAKPVLGWSVKRGLLGRPIYDNIKGKQLGTIVDLVVTDAAAPYVLIIEPDGFFELGGHDVAVPLNDVVERDGRLSLPGATRASLKAMPIYR